MHGNEKIFMLPYGFQDNKFSFSNNEHLVKLSKLLSDHICHRSGDSHVIKSDTIDKKGEDKKRFVFCGTTYLFNCLNPFRLPHLQTAATIC